MIAALVLALETLRVEPRAASWDEMAREVFDLRWILPEHLPLARGEKGVAWELEVELPRRVARVVEPSAVDPGAPRCFGDVVALARGADARAIEALLKRVAASQPSLWSEIAPFAKELVRDEALGSPSWDPGDDAGNDGLFGAAPLSFADLAIEPWKGISASKLVHQCATLVHADLEAIKAAEDDFDAYRKRPATSYETVYPVARSYVRGKDAKGRDFAALKMFFRSDLPFPFGDYECELRMLNRLRDDGRLVCDVASTSADFLWLAGRDLFVPVRSSDGVWQTTLMVRLFGFDLKGVPDGDSDRKRALRANLGSLKRESEALFRRRGGAPRTIDGGVPSFDVTGSR